MKPERKPEPTEAIEPDRDLVDEDLLDQAAMCAGMLRTLAAQWRSRLEVGRLGPHPRAPSLAFVNVLERASTLLESHGRASAAPARTETSPSVALEPSEERFQLLVESVRDYAILMLDPSGRIASWNAGAERIKGYKAEQIIGKHFRIFYGAEAIAAGQPERELEIATREGRYEEEGWRVRADGSRFWASMVLTPVWDRSGQLAGFAKVTRDATDRRDADEALRRAKLELERRADERTHELVEANHKLETACRDAQHAVRMREEVLAVVSHDLRNPLAAIHMAATVLLMKTAGDHQFRKHAETIHRSAARMEHLLSDLLDMASLQAGTLAVERRPEDAASIVAEVFDLHEPIAREKGVRIARAVELDGVRLFCDRDRVLQVFGNLIGNAIKFCQPGCVITVRGEVAAAEAAVAPVAQFAVADTGPGISGSELPHLFEPYWSADRHARKGTGLGLYISKGIVEAQGGRLRVESEQGKGATFYFTLPLAAAEPPAD